MKIRKHKSIFFDPKTSIIKPLPLTLNFSTPKPHKLISYILFIFCFWNFVYQIISLIHIYLDNYTKNRTYITWSIASMCTTIFCTFGLFFLYDNRKVLKKHIRQNKLDVKFYDYMLMIGYLCLIITYSVNIFFNESFENPQGKYGIMISFSNLLIVSGCIFVLSKDFRIKLIFIIILSTLWCAIIFSNDSRGQFYEIQVFKMIIKIACNVSLLIVFMFYYDIKPKHKRPPKQRSPTNSVLSNSFRIKDTIILRNDEEYKLYNFLNQIHSAIIIFDEEMDLKFYNKEIYSFLAHSPLKNLEASLAVIDRPQMQMSKSEYSKADILQKLNEITNIQLFDSEQLPIREHFYEMKTSFQGFTGENGEENKDFFSSISFKQLLTMMRLIMKNKNKQLYTVMKEKYILFTYFFNFPNTSPSQDQFYFTMHPSSLLIEIKASLVQFEGAERIMLMFTDATDRKKSLELYTINEHKDKLLANVAHEFRTPLNGISTMLELMKMGQDEMSEKMTEYVNTASFSVTLLKNYINDILDIAQLKNGKFSLHFSSFDLRNLINEIGTIINVQAKKKEITYEAYVDPFVPIFVVSDQTRLTQILLNLLSNSIKFTLKKGFISLHVNYDENIGVKFEVTDTGIGISEENMKNLFRKYGKIQNEINDALNPQGIGLGLVISKILAEELSPESNKKFNIRSEIGKGTCFSFYIENMSKENNEGSSRSRSKFSITKDENNSLYENENLDVKDKNFQILGQTELQLFKNNILLKSELKMSSSPPNNNHNNNRDNEFTRMRSNDLSVNKRTATTTAILFPVVRCLCPKILVVDDDMFNVISLQEILKIMGFESDYAANGRDAISKVHERNERRCCEFCQQYKLILMDSMMPIMTGVDATKILRQCEIDVKIIGCSGDNDFEKFRIAGADGFLKKPIERKELMNFLNDYKEILKQS